MVEELLLASDNNASSNSPSSNQETRISNGDVMNVTPSSSLAHHTSSNATPNSIPTPSTEYYPDSNHSSSAYEGGGSSLHNHPPTPYLNSETPTFSYQPPSPTLGRDDSLSDKKKKNKKIKRAMKHMLPNTNPKSREHDFHKLFKSLPDGETLIQDFSCALLRDILVQGRLYISQNWFCFYANILGWETLLTIEVRKIVHIKKEKTALVINNAISISTHEEKYFFSSFMSRDSAYNHVMGIWNSSSAHNAGQVPESEDMSHGGDLGEDNSDSFLSDDEDASSDIPPVFHHPPPIGLVENRAMPPKRLHVPDHGPRGTETISFNDEDDTCVCVSHYDQEHLNQEFEMNIEKMYKLLFNDDSSVQSKMKTLQKMEGYEATSWHDSLEGASERTLNYRVPLNANLGPKWAEVIEKQVLTTNSIAAKCYIVNCEVTNPNVPYGDKFNIVKRYCLTRSGESTCKLRMTSDVQYKKGVWGMVKSIIEKNSKEGINEYCEDLCMCLTEESAGPGVKIRKSASAAHATSSSRQTRPRSQTNVEQPTRAQNAATFVTDNYIAFILLMMAVLLILNLVLVYRLSSISYNCNSQIDILNSLPHSEEGKSEWIRILSQQQELHKKEIERWQEVLRWISKLVSEVHGSLDKLQKSSIYLRPITDAAGSTEL